MTPYKPFNRVAKHLSEDWYLLDAIRAVRAEGLRQELRQLEQDVADLDEEDEGDGSGYDGWFREAERWRDSDAQ